MGCNAGKKAIPGFTTRLANLGKAVVRWGLSGFPVSNEEDYQKRLLICQSCELLSEDSVCTHPKCGCPVARKAALATESCPIGKWDQVPAATTEKSSEEILSKSVAPSIAPVICMHSRYAGHLHFNRKDPANPVVEITVVCRECGTKMTFPEQGNTDKAVLLILPKSVEAGT